MKYTGTNRVRSVIIQLFFSANHLLLQKKKQSMLKFHSNICVTKSLTLIAKTWYVQLSFLHFFLSSTYVYSNKQGTLSFHSNICEIKSLTFIATNRVHSVFIQHLCNQVTSVYSNKQGVLSYHSNICFLSPH